MLQALREPVLALPGIALPIGVSFVVFEKITYVVDVYRGRCRPARDIWQYLTYVLFFPKLLAGPIIKYHDIISQFDAAPASHADDFFAGLARFMRGLVKKALVADALAQGADLVFAQDPARLTTGDCWWGVAFFALQIYFDFSGYSDMAIGIARMFGFHLLENFDRPYTATSITDFWRRWHMSFTSWIREYLYVPLGGNRGGAWRTYLNLILCFLASGIWHGAAWTFVIWGAYNGVFLILDRLFLQCWLDRMPGPVANAATVLIVMAGWVFFRSATPEAALRMLVALAGSGAAPFSDVVVTADLKWLAAAGIATCVMPRLLAGVGEFAGGRAALWHARLNGTLVQTALQSALALLFLAGVGRSIAAPFQPFLYFRF